MLLLTAIHFFSLLFFVFFFAPPALGAYFAARRLCRGGIFELATIGGAVLLLEGLLIFGVLGALGFLAAFPVFLANLAVGGALCFCCQRPAGPATPPPPWRFAERVLLAALTVGALLAGVLVGCVHSGTDTFLYHLYFPAVWIADGRISAVALIGMATEYYPIYGEMLFGWLMFPPQDASFAMFLQLASLLLAASAAVMIAELFGFARPAGLAAAAVMFFTGIVFTNAMMGYTDVLTGAWVAVGLALLLAGAKREQGALSVLAGLMLGGAAAIKYTGLLVAPVLLAAMAGLLFFLWRGSRRHLALAAVAAALAAAPCYILNFLKTGNPFYPVKIAVGGVKIFDAGLDFERPATGLSLRVVDLVFSDRVWDMNGATAIFYALLPLAALVFLGCRRKLPPAARPVFAVLAGTVMLLFVLQLVCYPAMAQARQFIPILMLASLLVIPPAAALADRWPRAFGPAALLLCFALNFSVSLKSIPFWLITFAATAALVAAPDRWFRKLLLALFGVFLLLLPFCFSLRSRARLADNYALAGASAGRCVELVSQAYQREPGGLTVASIGGWYNYMFLADMPGNRVVYVPISAKNSTHAHDFGSYAAMRENPISFEAWLERLRAAGADFLLIDLGSQPPDVYNREQELRWAAARPDLFLKLVDDGSVFFYRIRP